MKPHDQYADIRDTLFKELCAHGVVLIVIGGCKGSGVTHRLKHKSLTPMVVRLLNKLAEELKTGNPK